jgi:hypothetical protein
MRHPKETKVQNPYYDNSKGYVYGKLNSVFVVRGGFGYRKVMYSKENKGAVEIAWQAFAGPSLAFAKPVYLEIIPESAYSHDDWFLSEERYDPDRHYIDNIYGKAPFSRGFSEMKINPGGYAKFAINVEHSPEDEQIRALEAGVVFDLYAKPVSIMATENNKPFFLTLYLSLQFGRKWF